MLKFDTLSEETDVVEGGVEGDEEVEGAVEGAVEGDEEVEGEVEGEGEIVNSYTNGFVLSFYRMSFTIEPLKKFLKFRIAFNRQINISFHHEQQFISISHHPRCQQKDLSPSRLMNL